MTSSLVGSEMCIRDRLWRAPAGAESRGRGHSERRTHPTCVCELGHRAGHRGRRHVERARVQKG
eukprot:5228318-Prorocentrum_lima.AAC.1